MMAAGLVVLAGLGSYVGYGAYGRSNLDDLNFNVAEVERVTVARPVGNATGHDSLVDLTDASSTGDPELTAVDGVDQSPFGSGDEATLALGFDPTGAPQATLASTGGLARRYASMYTGADLHPKYWHEPLRAGTDLRVALGLPEGFTEASADDYRRFAEPKTVASGLRIPRIGVESGVSELAILDLGDSREYETPDNTVGHIPDTADPGELGNGWFFGHLESPFAGEGNVFQRLPEIPQLLKHFSEVGEGAVYVVVESTTGEYLYEVVATQVMHADDLRLYETDGVYITLVTCVPRLDYSHRLLVTAKLVGVRT
jgi:sortase (surface protein transpeptidase)